MSGFASRCLGEELTEYAAARLAPARTRHWDLHLVTCEHCRCAVAAERRLQEAMRLDPVRVPDQLRTALLAMAIGQSETAQAIPTAPIGVRREVGAAPLPTLRPDAPPMHRSAARSTLVAAMAATASAAAAIGISVTGVTPATATQTSVPTPRASIANGFSGQPATLLRAPGGGERAFLARDTAQSRP